jgi:hypothetical protein
LVILTTPEGADLPASAREESFPILVRLSKELFDFAQAKSDGADIRFSANQMPLAYQIEQWDADKGIASVWIRIPIIRGNAQQEITLHWGNAGAASESNGAAVFNRSNHFVAVMHLSDPTDPVKDEVATLAPKDAGTTPCIGVIGAGRHLEPGRGIACGEKIAGLPSGVTAHTTEAWFRAERSNAAVVGWGNEQAQGKVVMNLLSPPHVSMDCYFSNGNVTSESRLPMAQWIHVAHSCRPGDSRIYVNGQLVGMNKSQGTPLDIRNPARMWIGGWYNNYRFAGDVDEVRISDVARSADWVKLEYENQKPLQTLVGLLAQPGRELSAAPTELTIAESQSATITAQAGGAEKVYWILSRDGKETVVAVDRFSYTLDAGRVVGDTSFVLRFKAVYPHEVKIKNIPVTIKDTVPEPEATLDAPRQWNGREAIELIPVIKNLTAMQAAGAGDLHYRWTVSGGAVIKQLASNRLILKRSQYTGPINVKAAIDNGGAATIATATIQVAQPKSDPWVQRPSEKDETPEDNQFYARDDKNLGTLFYNGTLGQPADAVFLRVFAGDKLLETKTQQLGADRKYAFAVKLKPGLVQYRVEFGTKTAGQEQVLHSASNLVCGDAYLIDGQSNALATDTGEESPRETSPWIRSYGGPTGRQDGDDWLRDRFQKAKNPAGSRPNLWCSPVWKARQEDKAELGYWGMELARRLVASQQMPIFIINAAVGGSRIDEHQPTPTNHADLKTMYGRMLWRVQQAKLTDGIRGIIWHQGENDQGADGPTGGYGWETYQQYFVDMSAAWKEDFPNVQHYYIFQIWPNSCSMGNGHGDMLREMQRTLPRLYSNMAIMSTVGIKPPGPCHYPLTGWAEFARLLEPLIERDNYAKQPTSSITPPNLKRAYYTSAARDAIALEFDQPVVWKDSLADQFYLDGKPDKAASGSVSGNVATLKLRAASSASKITYLKETNWSQDKLLFGANGIAALTFCNVPIAAPISAESVH